MATIPDAAKKVPMMFRAQTTGRCQIQRLIKDQEPDALRWVNEWTDKTYPDAPEFGQAVQTRTYSISWRFVTNSGQDDSVIRPVIGARGWPFYPGSSMKGIFRRVCTPEQADRYCGKQLPGNDFQPGLLRFHGGYPTDTRWTEGLVDIVHPQEQWQVMENRSSSAFVQISLYQPELKFGISSTVPLPESEWETIWALWQQALAQGIGCRVSAGYGQVQSEAGVEAILYSGKLRGRGQAAQLIDSTGEFRPNMFRAAIRGHALRIFGGLTDAATAKRLVGELFGSTEGKEGTQGLLRMLFEVSKLEMSHFGRGSYQQPTFTVEGTLRWQLVRSRSPEEKQALGKLIKSLTRFAVLLGGFGKSWRRADHRLFFEDYYEAGYKPLIGCHWEWLGRRSLLEASAINRPDRVGGFIDVVREAAQEWMQLRGVRSAVGLYAPWREAWHPKTVQVWGRVAEDRDHSEAIFWLHGPYREAMPKARIQEGSIYRSSVTGQMGHVGRLWHRMYPVVRRVKDPENPDQPKPRQTPEFIELLTIFPDDSPESQAFLAFLQSDSQRLFTKLWPQ